MTAVEKMLILLINMPFECYCITREGSVNAFTQEGVEAVAQKMMDDKHNM